MTDTPLKDDLLDDPTPRVADAPEAAPLADAAPTRPAVDRGGRLGVWLAGIALFSSALLMAGGIWLWVQYQDLLARQDAVAARSGAGLSTLRDHLSDLGTRIDTQVLGQVQAVQTDQKVLEERQSRLRDSVNEVKALTVGDRKGWVLSETEYLLKLANERLTFMFDTETAITALEAADTGLKALDDPAVTEVRAELAREIGALKALPRADIPGLALRLSSLAELIDGLPLPGPDAYRGAGKPAEARTRGESPDTEPGHDRGWREAADKVWGDLRKLVVVRQRSRDQQEVLSPRESYFLRENLRLKLEAARLDLLQRHQETFRDDLATARGWVERYFVQDSAEVRHLLQSLDDLAAAQIDVERPAISGSLRLVRVLRAELAGAEAGREKARLEREARGAGTPPAAVDGDAAPKPTQVPTQEPAQ